jgi:hypothetical protein
MQKNIEVILAEDEILYFLRELKDGIIGSVRPISEAGFFIEDYNFDKAFDIIEFLEETRREELLMLNSEDKKH